MITKITFEEILPFWSKLWPDTEVRPSSSMKYLGGYDSSYHNNEIHYIGIYRGGEIVGVNSCFETGDRYRSRGLYVEEDWRGKGLSLYLLTAACVIAQLNKSPFIWSMPRKSVLPVYENAGFIKTSGFFKNTDYGPNCYVSKKL